MISGILEIPAMNRTPLKAGGALLLGLALGPGLWAGNKASGLAWAAAGAAALVTTLEPAAAAEAAAAPAQAKGLRNLYGPVSYKPMSFLCGGPILTPSPDSNLTAVDRLVEAATQAYQADGCEPLIAEQQLCIGPDDWTRPAKTRTMTARDYMAARLRSKPRNEDADRYAISGQVDSWAMELNKYVCKALGDFQRDLTPRRHAALFQRLLEAGDLHLRLQETQKRAVELHETAQREKAAVDADLLPKLKMARKMHQLTGGAGRRPQARQYAKDAQVLQDRLDEVQYEVDLTALLLDRCRSAVGRFSTHIEPVLEAMSPGSLGRPGSGDPFGPDPAE